MEGVFKPSNTLLAKTRVDYAGKKVESSLTEFSLTICVGHSLYTKEKQVEEK